MVFVDESGFRPLPAVVRTCAPLGQTPILREWLTWDHLSAISAITPAGKLYLEMQDRAFKGPDIVRFLEHLLSQIPGELLVVWDGLPAHRCRAIKAFLGAGAARRIWLERLPAYAPELNPDEGIWQYLKRVELRNLVCRSLDHRRAELEAAVERLRLKPDIIRGCIREPGCYFRDL